MRGIGVSVSTYVVAGEVVDGGLGQHGVVLELRLAEGGSVAGDDDKLGLAGAEALEGGLVTESDPVAVSIARTGWCCVQRTFRTSSQAPGAS
jgi:hypothetical protein